MISEHCYFSFIAITSGGYHDGVLVMRNITLWADMIAFFFGCNVSQRMYKGSRSSTTFEVTDHKFTPCELRTAASGIPVAQHNK